MRKPVTRLQAQLDVEDAVLWYETQQPELGLRFLDELDYVMKRVTASPLQFPEIHPRISRGLAKRFPYSVYFSGAGLNRYCGRRTPGRLAISGNAASTLASKVARGSRSRLASSTNKVS